jgi:hypothetical protein
MLYLAKQSDILIFFELNLSAIVCQLRLGIRNYYLSIRIRLRIGIIIFNTCSFHKKLLLCHHL